MTFPEIIKWATDERELAAKKLRKEGQLPSRTYLCARMITLGEILLKLEGLET